MCISEATANIKIKKTKKQDKQNIEKITERNFIIPKSSEYATFKNRNYSVSLLKEICKYYKLKISGNKPDIHSRIYKYLFESNYAIRIQKHCRRFFVIKYHNLIGPAIIDRSLCRNSTDFFTLENLTDIPHSQFFSFIGPDENIWGFNILSFYNLFTKAQNEFLNPYTREKISRIFFHKVRQIVRLSKILHQSTNIILNNNIENISTKKKIELKCLDLFQHMDELGNYTNVDWFMSLNREGLVQFVNELVDIWQYRAQLDLNVKKQICHPYGNPFRYVDVRTLGLLGFSILQKTILSIIEQFIKKGIDRESCNLGTSYILCGLTLVNNDAALALPWLYQSVSGIS